MWTFNVKAPSQPHKPNRPQQPGKPYSEYTLAVATVVAGALIGVLLTRR